MRAYSKRLFSLDNIHHMIIFYIIISIIWVIATDWMIILFLSDPKWLFLMQSAKTFIFIFLSAIILYKFLSKHFEKIHGQYSEVINNSQAIVYKIRRREDGRFVYTFSEGKIAQLTGKTTKNVLNKTTAETADEEREQFLNKYYNRAYNGEIVSYELKIDNNYLFTTLSPIYENGEVVEVVGSSVDISDLKKVEADLKKSKIQIENILESITEGFFTLDSHFNITYLNSKGETILNEKRANVLNKNIRDVFPKEVYHVCYEKFNKALHKNSPIKFVYEYDKWWYSVHAYPTGEGLSIYFNDITEQKQSEELLRKSDKLKIVGELAAGVAHEIRNPLTSIRGFVQLLKLKQLKEDYLDIMLSELDRIEFIISEFLVLAKPQVVNFQPRKIQPIIEHTIKLIETQAIIQNVQIHKAIDENIPEVQCEENQIKQVIVNILKNAVESMPNGGNITIEASRENNNYALIKIADEGCGIPQNRLKKIGEPFYTTKEKGTGLGLMVSYRIIESHGGSIRVESEEGKGTIFIIKLPL